MQNEQADQWEKEDLLEKVCHDKKGNAFFCILRRALRLQMEDPGIHHVIARALKDSVCRYKDDAGL